LIRSSGCVLRQDLSSNVTPEKVQENWLNITDMTRAKRFNSIHVREYSILLFFISRFLFFFISFSQEVTGELMNVLENLKNPSNKVYEFLSLK